LSFAYSIERLAATPEPSGIGTVAAVVFAGVAAAAFSLAGFSTSSA